MDRGFGSLSNDDEELVIDLSAMIDCVFILLIFFIVTTVFVEETGIKVNKPEASTAAALDKNSIMIAVSSEDQVFYGGKNIGIQGVRAAIKPVLSENKETPITIMGDTNASHGMVQRVHDAARQACRESGADENAIAVSTK